MICQAVSYPGLPRKDYCWRWLERNLAASAALAPISVVEEAQQPFATLCGPATHERSVSVPGWTLGRTASTLGIKGRVSANRLLGA